MNYQDPKFYEKNNNKIFTIKNELTDFLLYSSPNVRNKSRGFLYS